MEQKNHELIEKIRQQFDYAPYPTTPLDKSPKDNYQLLYIHNLTTAYYAKNQKIIDSENKVILDVGCGSGYTSLILAEANPKAKILGVDISEESLELARRRLKYHGFENVTFQAINLEGISQLGMQFDYINCDEMLYLVPDLLQGLQILNSVLKPQGIIRANLHSSLGRVGMFRGQKIFQLMGLLDGNPQDVEIEIVRDLMGALKDTVWLKSTTWYPEKATQPQWILMNYLFQGDKGYTIPEMFAALKAANLELVRMVDWPSWDVNSLFKDLKDVSPIINNLSKEFQLHLFELLYPVHRLLDFWCAHPQLEPPIPVKSWMQSDWQQARVYLHPQLRTLQIREDLLACIMSKIPFNISHYIPLAATGPMIIESRIAACLLSLWESATPTPVHSLVTRWLQFRPLHPITLEPMTEEAAWHEIQELLMKLEGCLYIMLER